MGAATVTWPSSAAHTPKVIWIGASSSTLGREHLVRGGGGVRGGARARVGVAPGEGWGRDEGWS